MPVECESTHLEIMAQHKQAHEQELGEMAIKHQECEFRYNSTQELADFRLAEINRLNETHAETKADLETAFVHISESETHTADLELEILMITKEKEEIEAQIEDLFVDLGMEDGAIVHDSLEHILMVRLLANNLSQTIEDLQENIDH